jgi:hypothetical protein
MAIGADVTCGFAAMKQIVLSGRKIHLSFKDFHADFLKRAEGDTFFANEQGEEIKRFLEKVIESKERMNLPLKVVATVPSKFQDEPVATFLLTLSLKRMD